MKKPTSTLRQSIRIDWKIVILSLVSASSFWMLNALNKRYTTKFSLPVRVEYESKGLIVVQPPPTEVRLTLTGIGWDLLRRKNWLQISPPLQFLLTDPTATKILSKATLFTAFSEQLTPLYLNYVVDDDFQIDIQTRISKAVRFEMDSLQIPLEEGHRMYSPILLSTDTFTLTGAKSYVEAYPDVYALRFDSSERINEQFEKAMLVVELPHKEVMQANPAEVEVAFSVGYYEQKEIILPVELLHFPRRGRYEALLSDSLITITYTVRSDQALAVKPELFTVIADYTQRNRQARTITPQIIQAPQEALEIHIDPPTLSLRYVRRR